MGRKISYLLILLITVMAMPLSAAFAQRQSDASSLNTENLKMLGAYIDVPSMDTSPVEFSIGNVRYRAPRNYITNMENYKGGPQTLVSFKVTVPDFQPFNDKTKDCMTKPLAYLPPGCFPVEFNVISGVPVSDDEAFHNASNLFHSQTPKDGLYGFELYETGPDNARIETYRKEANGHTLMIHCLVGDTHVTRDPVCNNTSRLKNQNGLEYSFYKSRLQYAQQIDGELRKLLDSFTVGKVNP